jgi:histidinol-phosphate/aromatic aminotransferase/cobyric acid decarboxylase-like protein/adenosyl cobinamide kinase/adenosyl cobinamide phosphate guanylyltransferase
MRMGERIIVLGGARSGKSAAAEALVSGARQVVYLATGGAGDAELAERVQAHRACRPEGWVTVETRDLVAGIRAAPAGSGVLIDALGPWLADRMTAHGLWVPPGVEVAPLGEQGRAAGAAVLAEAMAFWEAAAAHPGGPVVLVADESGLGITPADPSSRRWLDLAGAALQRLSERADRVLFTVAGRSLDLSLATVLPTAGPPAESAARGAHIASPGPMDFAVTVHGDGPPPHVRDAVEAALDDLGRYPDAGAARAAAAVRHGRAVEETLLVGGVAEAFRLLARTLRARLAAVIHPSVTEPESALRAAGIPVAPVLREPEQNWMLDPSTVPADADLVVLGTPNNPTGTLDDPDRVAALCRPGRIIVVDEAFADFVEDPASSLAGRGDLPGLVVVRSITLLWAVPGIRAGYLLAPPGIVHRLGVEQLPWPVSGPGLAALEVCCSDEAYRVEVARQVAAWRADLSVDLARLPGVRVWPSAANFLLLHVPDAPAVAAALRGRGIAVRSLTLPYLSTDYLRITVRDPDRQQVLLEALTSTLAEGSSARNGLAPTQPGQPLDWKGPSA